MIGCSAKGGTEDNIYIDGEDTGMKTGHAYSVIHMFELDRKQNAQSEESEEKPKRSFHR